MITVVVVPAVPSTDDQQDKAQHGNDQEPSDKTRASKARNGKSKGNGKDDDKPAGEDPNHGPAQGGQQG